MKLPIPAKAILKDVEQTVLKDQPVSAPATPTRLDPLSTTDTEDGGMIISCYLEPDVAKRLRSRSGNVSLPRFVWENVVRPAIMGATY